MIKKVENVSEEQLNHIKCVIEEAFVSNELFHNWGTEEERRGDVLKYMDHRVVFGAAAGTRQVPISKILLPYIEEALAQYKKNKSCLLFYDHFHQKMISTAQVNLFYQRACEKLGIHSAGQHCLRHTFATRCIEAGVEPIVLKTWRGHTNIHVTLDTYADVFASMHNSSMATFGDYIKGII